MSLRNIFSMGRGFCVGTATLFSWQQNTLPHYQETPHNHPIFLHVRHTNGYLQWSDSPLWGIVVQPFSFFLLTSTDNNNSSMGTNGYYVHLWHTTTKNGGDTRILFSFRISIGATLILLFSPPFSLAKGALTIGTSCWQIWGLLMQSVLHQQKPSHRT